MGTHTPGLVYDMANQTLHNVSADRYSIFFVAPELLEALKRLSFSVSLEAEDYPDMQLFRQVKAAVIKAKKVIAKAEGTA